ncbi:DUF559 domain-containing protein [Tessaracoccus rhinocerotis]|uniref:DUF559 domain-containing protein n=1 Tax=Tessaracoccus rhinocerotis TaxID=1689449 RepID=A0A553K0T4_9ACTN|nr:DUF559 domain-containing protein [Tessaracoccus rhinocerotis]TRY18312.1 DUF559 domain-containing protein [Tessaracoccus rhinocerotis]
MEHPLRCHPLVVRRELPRSGGTIDRLLRDERLVRMLPGVHRWSDIEETFELRVAATRKWDPDAIFVGSTAARLSWWSELSDPLVRVSSRSKRKATAWLRPTAQPVPDELVAENADGLRLASPECSALQLAGAGHRDAVFEALRRGLSLAHLNEALACFPKRLRGNPLRALRMAESMDEPWSPLERDAHVLLRAAKVTGWEANHRIEVGDRVYFADIAFPEARLIVELDGWTFHSIADRVSDNDRQNDLVTAGWTVVRFSFETLDSMVGLVQRVLAADWTAAPLALGVMSAARDDTGDWHIA